LARCARQAPTYLSPPRGRTAEQQVRIIKNKASLLKKKGLAVFGSPWWTHFETNFPGCRKRLLRPFGGVESSEGWCSGCRVESESIHCDRKMFGADNRQKLPKVIVKELQQTTLPA
jgi:hypothetical protein